MQDVIEQQLRTEMRNISAANDNEDESHESEEEPAPKRCNVEEDDAFDVLFGKETPSVRLPQGSHDVDVEVELRLTLRKRILSQEKKTRRINS